MKQLKGGVLAATAMLIAVMSTGRSQSAIFSYKFDEATGSTVLDSSPNNYDLTLRAMTWAPGVSLPASGGLNTAATSAAYSNAAINTAIGPAFSLPAYTLTGWINRQDASSGTLINLANAASALRIAIAADKLQLFTGGRNLTSASSSVIGSTNAWIFFAVSVDSSLGSPGSNYANAIKIYVGTDTSPGLTQLGQTVGGTGALSDFNLSGISAIALANTFDSVPGNVGNPNRALIRSTLDDVAGYPGARSPAEIDDIRLKTVPDAKKISRYLPFDRPALSVLRASPRKVFAHYFTPFPLVIGSNEPPSDYYTLSYLSPTGESNKHIGYGGFLRERPLPESKRVEANWAFLDRVDEVKRAVAIGLDGFSANILSTSGTQFDRVKDLLNAAATVDPGFKIMLMPDMQSLSDTSTLAACIQTLAAYPSCYRLADGRLVLAPYNAHRQTAAWWQGWLASMAAQGVDIAFVPLFQGWRTYAADYAPISYGFSDWGNRSAVGNQSTTWTNAASDAHQYVSTWMHPVGPQDHRPKSYAYWEAGNTLNLRTSWENGCIGKADWVQLTTWNDYSEGSEISPSTGTQFSYYDLNAYYISWFKTGTRPAVVREAIYYNHRQQATTAQPDLTQQTKSFILKPSGPATNLIEAVVFLQSAATLEITSGGVTTQHAVLPPVAVVTVPLASGQPAFRLVRNNQTVTAVTSAFPIHSSIIYQDLLYHGGSSLRAPVSQVATAYWPDL